MTEQKIQTKIIDYLRSVGAYVVKVVKASKAGVPDLIACYNGRFIAIEVKKEGGRVSSIQEYNLEKIIEAQGLAIIAYRVEDVKSVIKYLENGYENL